MLAPKSLLCAVCAERPAAVNDEVDGRTYRVCFRCKTEMPCEACLAGRRDDCTCDESSSSPPREPDVRERLLRVLNRSYGLDIAEVAQVLGDDTEIGRARVSAALNRARKAGLVKFTGFRMNRIYSITKRGQRTLTQLTRTRTRDEARL